MLHHALTLLAVLALPQLASADDGLTGWVPSRSTAREARAARLEASLAEDLQKLPHVRAARVHLALPASERLPLDRPLPPPTASILLEVTQPASQPERARNLAAAAVMDLTPANVAVEMVPARPEASEERLVDVGPFRVAEAHAGALRATLAALLGVNVALAGWVLLGRRRRA